MDRYLQDLEDANKSGYRIVDRRPDVTAEQCHDFVLMFLAKYGPVAVSVLLRESALVMLPGDQVFAAISDLLTDGRLERVPGGMVALAPPKQAPLWRRVLDRCWGGLFLLVAVILTTGLLLSALEGSEQAVSGQWVMAEVTAYCPCGKCTDGDLITANGTRTNNEPYALAADKSLPFGSRVYIQPGLGVLDQARATDRWFVVDDRGGALETESRANQVLRLDLRVKEHWWARKFGRRLLPVFVSEVR